MVDETEKKEEQQEKPQEQQEQPKTNILEETKKAIEDLKKEREEISKIKDELQQLRSDQLLSGTAGGRVEPEPVKEESALEYAKKVMSGGLNERAETTD